MAAFSSSSLPPDRIQQLVDQARHLAAAGQLAAAREHWQALLQYLPSDSAERRGVEREIAKLDARLSPQPKTDWKKRLGPFGVVIAALAKFKTAIFLILTKGKFFFSIIAFLVVYWTLFGWWFAVGFSASILIHEMGHYVVVRMYGLKAELPMFLPGLGAYVRWQGADVDPGVRARVSLAGPLFGFFSGLLAYALFLSTHGRVWLAVAQVAGWINLLNLIPVAVFDGGRAMDAIGKQQRIAILVMALGMAFVLHEFVFGFLALGTGYRLWKRDFPATEYDIIGYYFIALALANGVLSWYCLNQARVLFQTPGY